MNRFRGSIFAVVGLVLLVVAAWSQGLFAPKNEPWREEQALFAFEKDQLMRVRIERVDATIELIRDGAEWGVKDAQWRPSRSMTRRIAHQIHDLSTRAQAVKGAKRLEDYGLGGESVTVRLWLEDGRELAFQAGEANPTGVSHYIRPLPGDTVYVVKKAAVDYYRLPLDAFREKKFAWFDAAEATRIESLVDGRSMAFERVDERHWLMLEPRQHPASRDEVRSMLGRLSALRADSFVADQPTDLGTWGLAEPDHRVGITLADGSTVTVRVGHAVPDTDQVYVYRHEDDAVYAARGAMLEAYQLPIDQYRNRELVDLREHELTWLEATRGTEVVRIHRTSDGWRWADDSQVPGATPRRVATRSAGLEAATYVEGAVVVATTEVVLGLDTEQHSIRLGDELNGLRLAQVDDGPVAAVSEDLASVLDDLFREYRRKLDKDAERGAQ
jgi:hypothetical protein